MARKVSSRRALSLHQKNRLKASFNTQDHQATDKPQKNKKYSERTRKKDENLNLDERLLGKCLSLNAEHQNYENQNVKHFFGNGQEQCYCFLKRRNLFLPPGYVDESSEIFHGKK